MRHKGWACIEMEDPGPHECNWITCEMCQCSAVRYAHHMRHPNHNETLKVGSICAGNMETDLIAAMRREAEIKRRQPDWLRLVPGITDVTILCPLIMSANSRNGLGRHQWTSSAGWLSAQLERAYPWGKLDQDPQHNPKNTNLRRRPNVRGVPPTSASIHWIVISYHLARVPTIARAIANNRYNLWVPDRGPSFDARTLGQCPHVVTIDRTGQIQIYEMEDGQ